LAGLLHFHSMRRSSPAAGRYRQTTAGSPPARKGNPISQQVTDYRPGSVGFGLTATLTATGVDDDGQGDAATDNLRILN
jgi:hypothetical protein